MKKKIAALALALGMALTSLTACSTPLGAITVDNYSTAAVATIGSDTIYLSEVNYYLRSLEYVYEMYYGSYYGTELWTQSYSDTMTYGEYMRSMSMNKVYQIHILAKKAEALGLSLTDAQEQKIEDAVDNWLEKAGENLQNAISLNRDQLIELYTRNAMANLAYEYAIADTDREVSDEEARQWEVSVTTLSTSSETYDAEAVKDQLLAKLAAGEDLSTAVSDDEFADYSLTANTYDVGTDEYTSTFGPTAVALSTGGYDAVLIDSTGYWYVVYCTDDFDESATENEKESIIADREDELFQTVYSGWKEEASSLKVNEDVLELLSMEEFIYVTTAAEEETTTTEAADETAEASSDETASETETAEETESAEETETVEETEVAEETETVEETETAAESETAAETIEETSAAK